MIHRCVYLPRFQDWVIPRRGPLARGAHQAGRAAQLQLDYLDPDPVGRFPARPADNGKV